MRSFNQSVINLLEKYAADLQERADKIDDKGRKQELPVAQGWRRDIGRLETAIKAVRLLEAADLILNPTDDFQRGV